MISVQFKQVKYQKDNFHLEVDFTINHGDIVTLIGPSGSGKSTLLNLIAGFSHPKSGEISILNKVVTYEPPKSRPISILFQENNLFNHLTVYQNLGLGLSPKLKLTQKNKSELEAIAHKLEIGDYLTKLPTELSGGQKQRVAIGRCLLQNRPILLLDEPFSSLDPQLKMTLFELIYQLQAEYQFTLIMVTHQYDDILPEQRCIKLEQGEITFDDVFDKGQF